jgi:hypothetical protein
MLRGRRLAAVVATAAMLISGVGVVATASSADASASAVGHYLLTDNTGGLNLPLDVNSDGTATLNLAPLGLGICPAVWTQQSTRFAMSVNPTSCTSGFLSDAVYLGTVSKKSLSTAKRPGSGTKTGNFGGTGPFTWYAIRQP